jgi:hypothetical protein
MTFLQRLWRRWVDFWVMPYPYDEPISQLDLWDGLRDPE